MFSKLKGTKDGHRIGLASATACGVIVNSAKRFAKDDFLTADTLRVLREIFVALFLAASMELRDRTRTEAAGYSAIQYLADFVAANSGGAMTSEQALRKMVPDFQSYVKEFAGSLAKAHPELIGESAVNWAPAILSEVGINIGFYIHERFGDRVPDTMQPTINGTLIEECSLLMSAMMR